MSAGYGDHFKKIKKSKSKPGMKAQRKKADSNQSSRAAEEQIRKMLNMREQTSAKKSKSRPKKADLKK